MPLTSSSLYLRVAACMRPEASKLRSKFPLGEDAYFVLPGQALGVADGVGSWSLSGIDAGEYSRCLMQSVHHHLLHKQDDLLGALSQAEINAKQHRGSSTFCVMALDQQTNVLNAMILGDSSMLVARRDDLIVPTASGTTSKTSDITKRELRNNNNGGGGGGRGVCASADGMCAVRERTTGQGRLWKIVYKAEEQQVVFNMPRQIGERASIKAAQAVRIGIPLKAGDVIVGGSDGLFDNLFVNDVLQIVARTFEEKPCGNCNNNSTKEEEQKKREEKSKVPEGMDHDSHRLAVNLVDAALRASQHVSRKGPFSALSARAGYLHEGGKTDDITVVVGIVACKPYSS